jgi:hypothetical protein
MNNFTCEICKSVFTTKYGLEKHKNKKNKCNIETAFKCNKCNKFFLYNKTLKRHEKDCDINKINEELTKEIINKDITIELAIKSIIKSSINYDDKVDLLIDYNINLSKEKIKLILNSDMSNDEKTINFIHFITNKPLITNSTINNGTINTNNTKTENSNNVTNNIQINSFGKEDISYLDGDYFKNLIMNQHIEKGYVQLIKDIYLNKEHPENGTVKVENINNKYAHIYRNDKWDVILKADLKEQLHQKNYTILKMHYDKLSKSMSVPKREETRTFLSRDEFGDPHMMYVIDKIILLFYNGEYEEVLEKDKINKNI